MKSLWFCFVPIFPDYWGSRWKEVLPQAAASLLMWWWPELRAGPLKPRPSSSSLRVTVLRRCCTSPSGSLEAVLSRTSLSNTGIARPASSGRQVNNSWVCVVRGKHTCDYNRNFLTFSMFIISSFYLNNHGERSDKTDNICKLIYYLYFQ